MKERELNCATIGVAIRTDISGRATAEETSRALRIGKWRIFGRTANLTILRSLIAASFVLALAPLPARADEEERGRDKKFEALEAKVESLQATVSALESQIDTLQKQLAVVQCNKALALGPFQRRFGLGRRRKRTSYLFHRRQYPYRERFRLDRRQRQPPWTWQFDHWI